MAKILELSMAGMDEAKKFYWGRLGLHCCTIVLAIIGIFTPDGTAIYILGILAFVSEAAAWLCNYYGDRVYGLGRKGLRRAILIHAYGMSQNTLDIADLRLSFSSKAKGKAEKMNLDQYYGSKLEPGTERFREDLQESAFHSAHLFEKAANNSLGKFLLFFAASFLVILFTAPHLTGNALSLFFRVVVLFVSFIPASDEFRNIFAWKGGAKEARSVRDRLSHADLTKPEELLMIVGDYVASVASTPLIPTSLHKKEREHLNKEWNEFKKGV